MGGVRTGELESGWLWWELGWVGVGGYTGVLGHGRRWELGPALDSAWRGQPVHADTLEWWQEGKGF